MILREEIDAILSNAVLKEERGVAAYKYKGVVDEIIKYCNEYVKPGNVVSSFFKNIFGGNKKYKITIPREITKKIDFIENLDVVITLEEMGGPYVTNSGGGYIQHFNGPDGYFTKDGKIYHSKIVVEGYHHNGKSLQEPSQIRFTTNLTTLMISGTERRRNCLLTNIVPM